MMNNLPKTIIMFDGVCNYCNKMVNFCIKHDKKKKLHYTSLQSNTGMSLISYYNIPKSIDSIILIDESKVYYYSDAALKIARHLNPPIRFIYIFKFIPTFLRDALYKWVAKNRYKWFGKKDTCMIPSKEVKHLFLE
ncbi:MAG TPA: thiol-disulfide oxidoreductase DCC family protein [Chitinophagaceae bacterium]|nr:thiol-disulfide oxidoreductase DCC family protein [Chitinophagaceae bacterium]HNL81804.1 thiol-disulfide oxidoreductase DCC family protein [Chitinophagaceae bacterium]HNM33310.1 thiol-disulfide oxidoreductase DCC family protein [Chitinophagaceae bacterium]